MRNRPTWHTRAYTVTLSLIFGSIASERKAEVLQFLSRVFGVSDSPGFQSDLIDWKYFEPHPFWPGTRSYVFETPAGISAHGCVMPVRYLCNTVVVESMQIVDWAAGPAIPGGGLLVYRRCLEIGGGTLLAIGGSADTRRLIPQVKWFAGKEDLRVYARPLRAWPHWNRSTGLARNLARSVRNLLWKVSPALPVQSDWTCRAVSSPETFFMPEGDFLPLLRTRQWFEYLLRCPSLKTGFILLERTGVPAGHALLGNAAGSVRIADFVVDKKFAHETTRALSALIRHIAAQPGSREVAAGSSLSELWPHFEACGLRLRDSLPVYHADPRKITPVGIRIETTLMIGDSWFFYNPEYPFYC